MTGKQWQAISVMPTLGVTDLDQASAYYAKLGFEEHWRFPEGAESTHMGMRIGELSFMFSHCPDGVANRQNVYLIVKELRSFHEQVKKALPEVSPVVETDYAMIDFTVTDPWGHRVTFGEGS